MIFRSIALAALVALIAACSDRPPPGSSIQTPPSQTRPTAVPESEQRQWMSPTDYRAGGPVPPMEENRKVNEQSCTQGIDLTAGNLRCR